MAPPADLVIRAQEPADLDGLASLFAQPGVLRGTLGTPYLSRDQRQKRYAAETPNVMRLVAGLDGKIVGSASLHRHDRPRRAHAAAIGIVVHDDYAGRGIGGALLAALIDVADRWWNLKRLELEAHADNDRAIALYTRFGFTREGILRAYSFRDGQFVDAVTMARLTA